MSAAAAPAGQEDMPQPALEKLLNGSGHEGSASRNANMSIHHVTAIAGDPVENLSFCTRDLGLRLVKKMSILTIRRRITSITVTRPVVLAPS
jgi:Glyoxalase/Bleomycin resistance protein/Dioxygenase superfamily